MCEDEHKLGKFCLQRFVINKTYTSQIVITLNQIHSRFVDETMRGSYQYAPLKLILAKVVKETEANPKGVAGADD